MNGIVRLLPDGGERSFSAMSPTLENVRFPRNPLEVGPMPVATSAAPSTDDDLRERVLAAADRLYYRRGIQAVGMDELRTEAGVPLKRLYALFGGKDAIVAEVLRRRGAMWEEGLTAAVAAAPAPRDRVLAVYDYLAGWFGETDFHGCIFINSFGELGGCSPEVAALVRQHKATFQAYVADLVAAVGGPPALAAQLAILAEGAQTTAAIAGSGEAAAQARAAAEVLVDAAGVPRT
jgi:AcrR family transcriptional regulator